MARRRLTPARPGLFDPAAAPAPSGLSPAPIAQVAGEASARAALDELAATLGQARAEGRMIERIALDAINERHLLRDRQVQDEEEMDVLMESLRTRGQQTPIEVIALPAEGGGPRYGLISGWRRLSALRRLHRGEPDDPRFATIKALVIAPETAQDAYLAMVEENEIRVDPSYFERARLVLGAVHEGIYPTVRSALQGLYGTVSRSKRSKIGSFTTLVEAFGGVLRFPHALTEKQGLALVRALEERGEEFGTDLRIRLRYEPLETPEAERRLIADALAGRPHPARAPLLSEREQAEAREAARSAPTETRPAPPAVDLRYDAATGRIELTGPGVDAGLHRALRAWLAERGRG